METTMEMKKIEAVRVNDFEFSKDRYGNILEDRAQVSIRVVNKIFMITLSRDKQYGIVKDKKRFETKVYDKSLSCEMLRDLGIDIQYNNIIREFNSFIAPIKWKKHKERIELAKEEYKKLWIHNVAKQLSKYDNLTVNIFPALNRYIFMDSFDRCRASVTVGITKDISVTVIYDNSNGRFIWGDYSNRKWTTKPERISEKVYNHLTDRLKADDFKKKQKERKEKEKENALKFFTEQFGQYGEITYERNYHSYGHRNGGDYYDEYFIKIGKKQYKISHSRSEEKDEYSFSGIFGLTYEKISSIMKVIKD